MLLCLLSPIAVVINYCANHQQAMTFQLSCDLIQNDGVLLFVSLTLHSR
jgi:hypothetical protein